MLLLLLSCFSHVRLCVTPYTAAYQAPPSLRFSRQEHWSGLQFPSPMHESEKWKWSHPAMSDSSRLHGLQPTRCLHPWDFPGRSTEVDCHCLLHLGNVCMYVCMYACKYVSVCLPALEIVLLVGPLVYAMIIPLLLSLLNMFKSGIFKNWLIKWEFAVLLKNSNPGSVTT